MGFLTLPILYYLGWTGSAESLIRVFLPNVPRVFVRGDCVFPRKQQFSEEACGQSHVRRAVERISGAFSEEGERAVLGYRFPRCHRWTNHLRGVHKGGRSHRPIPRKRKMGRLTGGEMRVADRRRTESADYRQNHAEAAEIEMDRSYGYGRQRSDERIAERVAHAVAGIRAGN